MEDNARVQSGVEVAPVPRAAFLEAQSGEGVVMVGVVVAGFAGQRVPVRSLYVPACRAALQAQTLASGAGACLSCPFL